MALLPSNQRDQVKILVAAVALIAVGAYWYLSWSPKQAALTATAAHVDSLEQANAAAKRAVSRGSVAALKAQATKYENDLALMRRLVPSANEVPTLLEEVSTAAREAGLDLTEVSPEGVVPGDQFDTYRYKLGVNGGYHAIAQFLTNIGSLERIVAPINLSLAPSTRAPDKSKSQSGALLDAKFEIQTYVVHTGPAPIKQAGTTAGPAPAAGAK
jgi:type IV pilus assembly protein PilO